MIAQPHQFGSDDANRLAAGRNLDAHQLLDGHVPGHVVRDGRNVVHPVRDRHVLVVVELFAELLETGVQIADVRNRIDDPFAFELEHQAQGRMRGRMLRTEIHRPQIRLRLIAYNLVESGRCQRHNESAIKGSFRFLV